MHHIKIPMISVSAATTPSLTVAACCFQLATITDDEGQTHKACFSGLMLTEWMINVRGLHNEGIHSSFGGWFYFGKPRSLAWSSPFMPAEWSISAGAMIMTSCC